jgi:hypothetical protein
MIVNLTVGHHPAGVGRLVLIATPKPLQGVFQEMCDAFSPNASG